MAWRRDGGSSSAIGLSVAAATLAMSFVVAQVMVERPASTDSTSPQLEVAASTALDVIISQGGLKTGGGSWIADPDAIARFGLAKDGTENFLDYVKIKAMRNATMLAANNDAPDYADVRAALGISGKDFHLRTYPVLPDLGDPRWSKDPRGRAAYIAHFDSAAGYATATGYANTSGSVLNVTVAVRNDGSTPHIFRVEIGAGNLAGDDVIATDDRHTRLLAPGEVQNVWVNFPKMAYSPALTGAKIEVIDAYSATAIAPFWISATAPSGSNVAWAPLVTAGSMFYEVGETVKFDADHFEGDGTRLNQPQNGRFVLVGPNGNVWVNQSISLPKNKAYEYSCANCSATGVYRATVWDSGVTRNATDIVYVSSVPLFGGGESRALVADREVLLVQQLVANFNGRDHDETTDPEGDVFSDSSHIRDLDDVLPRYTTLVVGSEVKQNAMNAAETKWAIAEWVQAGGNLIVLGTLESQSRWLEPVYHAAQQTANGGIGAPDPTHPMLTTPNKMDYTRYLDNARAWNIDEDSPFTHILSRGQGGGGSYDDTLAVSNPGAYNDGTVVLTSYMAGALTSPQDDQEALRFLHNLLSQSYNMLYLDYGPPVPDRTPVGSAERLVAIPHPNVPGAVVEVKIVMYAWS